MRLLVFTFVVLSVTGCNEERIELGKEGLTSQFQHNYSATKKKTIAEMTPYLELSLYRLKSICTEVRDNELKTHCNNEYSKLEEQVDAYKTGKWDDIQSISLDEFAYVSAGALRANQGGRI